MPTYCITVKTPSQHGSTETILYITRTHKNTIDAINSFTSGIEHLEGYGHPTDTRTWVVVGRSLGSLSIVTITEM